MDIKIGIDVVSRMDGNKSRIINIINGRVEILDYGDIVPWFIDIRIARVWFKPLGE